MNRFFMQDYAGLDARSVKAALQGLGDGRDRRFDAWQKMICGAYPKLPLEACSELASRALRAGLCLPSFGMLRECLLNRLIQAALWRDKTPQVCKNSFE